MFGSLGKIAGAAIAPVAALGTALQVGGDVMAYKGQKKANQSNERIAKENRVFQERMANTAMDYQKEMSNTAYQRGMDDMRSAGLNPILAYSQGGASTPVGHGAPGSVATMQNPAGVFSGTATRSAGIAQTGQSIMKQRQEVSNLKSQLENDKYYRSLNDQQQTKVFQETEKIQAEINKVQAETAGIEADNVEKEIMANFYDSAEFARIAKGIGISPNILKSIWKGIFGRKRR